MMMSRPSSRSALVLERQALSQTDIAVAPVPQAVTRSNARSSRQLLAAAAEGLQPPPFCAGEGAADHARRRREAGRQWHACARAAGDAAAFRATPELDGSTLALAAGLVHEMQLGRGAEPGPALGQPLGDRLCRPHATAPRAQEMCLQLLELDRELGDFFALLDRPRHRLCAGADRRSRRPRHSRAAAACTA